ncbi:aspyridone synthetase trans-acting enoyl reductase [Microdochium nivale]|nr:aspyridone synthetase trans-acting enoyl reductase [Microdochium nivale]
MDPGPAHKRRRPAVACTECRRRKIACDLGNPCGPCFRSNANLHCVYNNYNAGSSGSSSGSSHHGNNNSNDYTKRNHSKNNSIGNSDRNASTNSGLPTISSSSRTQYQFGSWPDEAGFNDPQTTPKSSSIAAQAVVTQSKAVQPADYSEQQPLQLEMLFDHSLEHITDSINVEMQAFISDGDFDFSESCFMPQSVKFGQSWMIPDTAPSPLVGKSRSASSSGSVNSNFGAIANCELPEVRCDGLRGLLHQIAYKHDGPRETSATSADNTSAQRLDQTVSNLERYARQQKLDQQQQKQQQLQRHQRDSNTGRTWLEHPNGGSLARIAQELFFGKAERNALLDVYFCAFESVLYILDPTMFLESCKSFWSRTASQLTDDDDVVACKILIAVSIGCCVHPDLPMLDGHLLRTRTDDGLTHASEWFRLKMTDVTKIGPPDVAQILCLLALAQNVQGGQLSAAPGGSLLGSYDPTRVGMQLGFHRDGLIRKVTLGSQELESRRMLWATMLELCMQVSLDEGLPPPIYPESYDCAPPTIATSATSLPAQSSSIIGHLAQTQRLRLQALHIIHSPGSSATDEQCYQLAADLDRMCRQSAKAIRTARVGQQSIVEYQVKNLEACIVPVILALHGRSTDRVPSSPEVYYWRCMRMECAAQLLSHTLSGKQPRPSSQCADYYAQDRDQSSAPYDEDLFTSMCMSWEGSPVGTRSGLPPRPRRDSKVSTASSSSVSVASSSALSSGATPLPLPPAQDAYISLCLRGHGHTLQVQRQAVATLFLDLIDDLDEDRFDLLHGAARQELLDLLRNAVALFERRMRLAGGAHSTREYALFVSAAAYVDALIDRHKQGRRHTDGSDGGSGGETTPLGRNVDETVAKAALAALDVCTQVVRGLPTRKGTS